MKHKGKRPDPESVGRVEIKAGAHCYYKRDGVWKPFQARTTKIFSDASKLGRFYYVHINGTPVRATEVIELSSRP